MGSYWRLHQVRVSLNRLAIIGGVSLIINKPYIFDMDFDSKETYIN